jgi:Glycosyl transferases group 1
VNPPPLGTTTDAEMRVWYLVPDHEPVSWGNGTLYTHVRLLRAQGVDAVVLHQRRPFRLPWLHTDVPIAYLEDGFAPAPQDVLVVPELQATRADIAAMRVRRVVFVQGSFLMLRGSREALNYTELGFERAMVIMPHIRDIVERHFGIAAELVPPVIAPYFFEPSLAAATPRTRRVLLVYKPGYAELGYPDYDIAGKLLRRRLAQQDGADGSREWSMMELRDQPHREVARLMRESAVLISLNTMEAFNSVVPEAMACGCIPLCYEAFGGQDYLRHEHNAVVFPNHYVYPLMDRLFDLMDRYDALQPELEAMRRAGARTAAAYGEAACAAALRRFFADSNQVSRARAPVMEGVL